MRRTYRFRLYPTEAQRDALEAQLRFACELYNAALEQRRDAYTRCGRSVGYHEQSAELTALRRERRELLPPDGMNFWCQQAVLRRLDHAFNAFFRRIACGEKPGYPRFRSARRFDTLIWTLKGNAGGVAITNQGRLRLQGVGAVKVKWHRSLPTHATLGEVRVTRRGDRVRARFYVSIAVELGEPEPRPATGEAVGVDLGVRVFAALSTGELIEGPRAARANAKRVRRASRKLARCERGSRRRRKAASLLARHRERETNRRRDQAHKASRSLVERFDLIAHEDLQIKNMLRSAAGTLAEPGCGVRQKAGLNREIADQGWGTFLSLLAYKAEEAGRQVVKVHPANTSRTCSRCAHVDARSRTAERFCCVACGHRENADANAAKVILGRALAQTNTTRPGRGRQAPTAPVGAVA